MKNLALIVAKKLRLYWYFYKSTIAINWAIAAIFSAITFNIGLFPYMTFTTGFILVLVYKKISKEHEYYFYHNSGITKLELYISCFIFNLITAIPLTYLVSLCNIN